MCEIRAFVLTNGQEEKVFESVNIVRTDGDDVELINIFGEKKTLKARFKRYDNNNRMIVFELAEQSASSV